MKKPAGMNAFIIIWIGQTISILASGMSGFALSLWMYEKTESAMAMGLQQVFYMVPFLLMSIPAGVMVDKYNRKMMMMVSDLMAVVATFGIMFFSALGVLETWHLYLAAILYGLGNTFQWPAYSAAISTMVPKEQLGRANGLMSLMEAGPGVVAPLLAGVLYPVIGLTGILVIDVITFFFAIGALAIVHVPQPRQTEAGREAEGSMLREALFGFKYIFARPSLLGLQMVFFFGNLFSGIGMVVFAPMILARTDQNSLVYGTVQTAGAIGALVGGVVMSAWGGFKRRTNGVLAGWIYSGIFGTAILGLNGLPFWLAGMVLGALAIPVVNGSNQAIWQSKVAPDVQGRVFSARRLIAWMTNPIAPIIGGALADFALEPAMRAPQSGLASAFGWLVGTGPGAGMGLLMVFSGLAITLVGLAGYGIPAIYNAENILPDHDQAPGSEPA